MLSFIDDEALTRGAAIAFYTATSIAPVLLIVIAGLVFGQEAAQNAITSQFSDLMGRQTAEVLQSAIASAAEKSSGMIATIIGIAVLIATASGVFGEMQAALNAIWKANPQTTTVSRLIRARAVSLGLVGALGFSAYRFADNQRRSYGFRRLFGHCLADGKANSPSAEFCCVGPAFGNSFWCDLQGST